MVSVSPVAPSDTPARNRPDVQSHFFAKAHKCDGGESLAGIYATPEAATSLCAEGSVTVRRCEFTPLDRKDRFFAMPIEWRPDFKWDHTHGDFEAEVRAYDEASEAMGPPTCSLDIPLSSCWTSEFDFDADAEYMTRQDGLQVVAALNAGQMDGSGKTSDRHWWFLVEVGNPQPVPSGDVRLEGCGIGRFEVRFDFTVRLIVPTDKEVVRYCGVEEAS